MIASQERRIHPRYGIDWPVALRPNDVAWTIGGRGQNLSRGGALVAVPLSIPVRAGQRLELEMRPRADQASHDIAPETREARVVRVQRGSCILDGLQLVGLTFED